MPLVMDIWFGGPNADGRGLNKLNGGYNPVPGLVINSPSWSTPTSSARYLTRPAGWPNTISPWLDTEPGVLKGLGGRLKTGSTWSFGPGSTPEWLGPLPALTLGTVAPARSPQPAAPLVTDTVRRYAADTGLSVSDVTGGIVQQSHID